MLISWTASDTPQALCARARVCVVCVCVSACVGVCRRACVYVRVRAWRHHREKRLTLSYISLKRSAAARE